jgi:peptidoglycan/LPS O-acetylase OafA/YrhL
MKRLIYFILAVITVVYIGFLCYMNITGNPSEILKYISIYGGLAISLVYALVNFTGNPLKIVFLILLIVATVVLVLTIAVPEMFRNLFGL